MRKLDVQNQINNTLGPNSPIVNKETHKAMVDAILEFADVGNIELPMLDVRIRKNEFEFKPKGYVTEGSIQQYNPVIALMRPINRRGRKSKDKAGKKVLVKPKKTWVQVGKNSTLVKKEGSDYIADKRPSTFFIDDNFFSGDKWVSASMKSDDWINVPIKRKVWQQGIWHTTDGTWKNHAAGVSIVDFFQGDVGDQFKLMDNDINAFAVYLIFDENKNVIDVQNNNPVGNDSLMTMPNYGKFFKINFWAGVGEQDSITVEDIPSYKISFLKKTKKVNVESLVKGLVLATTNTNTSTNLKHKYSKLRLNGRAYTQHKKINCLVITDESPFFQATQKFGFCVRIDNPAFAEFKNTVPEDAADWFGIPRYIYGPITNVRLGIAYDNSSGELLYIGAV